MNTRRQRTGQRVTGVALGALLATHAGAQEAATNAPPDVQKQPGLLERKLELIQDEARARAKEAASKFEVTVYGRVKFDTAYDTGRTSPGDWALYALPQTPEEDNELNATARTEIGARGGYLQLTANATDKLTLGAGYGVDDPDDGDLAKGARTLNSRLYGNTVYALTPNASVGVEVPRIDTEYKEQDSADALRMAFSGTLRF